MCCIIDCKLYDLVLKFFGFAKPQMVNIKTRKIMKTISDPDSDSVRVRIPISVLSSNEPLARLQFKMFLKIVCPLFFSFLFAFLMFFVFFFFGIQHRKSFNCSIVQSFVVLHIAYRIICHVVGSKVWFRLS